jgi:DNA (cytosine-5)-methyltransferase 1
MARLGLGPRWRCLFANDHCPKKGRAYRANFGPSPELVIGDVTALTTADLPGQATLAWASFPCQDLSLAGRGSGLAGRRSGAFWPFWRLIEALAAEGRAPRIVAIENVVGALSSRGGADFGALVKTLADSGRRLGALVVDAVHFVPQSRPRLFIVSVGAHVEIPAQLVAPGPVDPWRPRALTAAWERLPVRDREAWVWWNLPPPGPRRVTLADIVEDEPAGVGWRTPAETKRLLALMSPRHREKVREAGESGRRVLGTVYRRTRVDGRGRKVQRAEVRFDQVSGCLRTPAGGSSRQSLLVVEGRKRRSRLLSARETARLMGAPDSYLLPETYNEAYHLMGDAVVAPVVSWLERQLLAPLAAAAFRCRSDM